MSSSSAVPSVPRNALAAPAPLREADDRAAPDLLSAVTPRRANSAFLVEWFRTIDAGVAVITLVTVLLVTNFFYGMPEGLDSFFRLRLTVKNFVILVVVAMVWPRIFGLFGLYQLRKLHTWKDELIGIVAGCSLGTVLVFAVPLTSVSGAFTPSALIYFWVGVIGLTFAARHVARRILVLPRSKTVRQVLIVGSGPRAHRLYRQVSTDPDSEQQVVGFVDTTDARASHPDIERQLLGELGQLESILMRRVIDEVLVALPIKSRYEQIQEVIRVCECVGVDCKYLADVFQSTVSHPRFEDSSIPSVTLKVAKDDQRLLVKRTLDLVGSAVGLIVLAPVLLAIALAIKVSSPGPALFLQERYGLNKRRFRMLKFRTMVTNAEELQATLEAMNDVSGPVFKIYSDPRITPVGRLLRRTSLDELPQLWNVLLGHMSLVGPRPLPTRDVSNFSEAWPMRRFSVRPGLTCLWQISGRSHLEFNDWMRLDLQYIDEWSLKDDLRILALTVPAVIRGTGAA